MTDRQKVIKALRAIERIIERQAALFDEARRKEDWQTCASKETYINGLQTACAVVKAEFGIGSIEVDFD